MTGTSKIDSVVATAAALNPVWWPADLNGWLQAVLAIAGITYLLSKHWLLWRRKKLAGDE